MARPKPSPLSNLATLLSDELPSMGLFEASRTSRKPDYRRVIEAALRAYQTPAAEEALAAYRDDPLLFVHPAHYPVMYNALQSYQQNETVPDLSTVITQVEYAMTKGSTAD